MEDSSLVSVSADLSYDDNHAKCVLIKIQADSYELNIWVPDLDIPKLRNLPKWEPGSEQIGSSAGRPAFWSLDDGRISVLIGQDDQTWDFGVSFDTATHREIVEEAERVAQSYT